jgi:ureidoglycolate dehydrogenase (NAD+)
VIDLDSMPVSFKDLHQFVAASLERVGLSSIDAQTVADVLVETDAMGVFTHGTKLLRDYMRRISAGGIRHDARPIVERQGPAWAVIDGQSAMGHVVACLAMQTAIEKAKHTGIAYVGARQTNHFGAAGYYALMAARRGMIGVAMSNDIPSVAAPGSRRAVLGSNPLAYAIPTSGDPIVLDMATSTVAGGKVYAAHQRGEAIPDNWIIGPDGLPTTDGSLYPSQAALAPMAGHKGFGIALLIETLSGILTGAAVTWGVGSWIFGDPTTATNHGAAFLAIDVETIMPRQEFLNRMDALALEIRSTPAAQGMDRIMLPGDREWSVREQSKSKGIALPPDVVDKLKLVISEFYN